MTARTARPAAIAVAAVGILIAAPWTASAPATAASTGSSLIAAGDIANCTSGGAAATAELIRTRSGIVAPLGDNADGEGSARDYADCYDPTWGRFTSRTRPTAGNHDYITPAAAGYFGYFGAAAGPAGKGYYSYPLGTWHVVVLNSNCAAVTGGCGAGSPQEQWLRADLAAHPNRCTLAYWHDELFGSGAVHSGSGSVRPLYRALYEAGAEVVLNGDALNYERFAPQTPAGAADPAYGIREFVVGTGGSTHELFGTVAANSEIRDDAAFGVLRLTLGDGVYGWEFVSTPAVAFSDTGTGTCHAAPSQEPGVTLLAAGSVAGCGTSGDTATAGLVRQQPGVIAALGDLAAPHGSTTDFTDCYDPVWGEFTDRTRPVPGHQEYETPHAAPYFAAFGARAGDPTQGYYSYDVGSWHVVALNSRCGEIGGCAAGSPQERWLRADLASHPVRCTLAYWHDPLFTSAAGGGGGAVAVRPLFSALAEAGAEMVLTGHSRQYERFAPQSASGAASPDGVREFVVGTGGLPLTAFGVARPNSEVRGGDAWGVLKLTLRWDSYEWEFLPVTGHAFTDTGSGTCH